MDKLNHNLNPKLRFKNFEGAWCSSKLGDLVEISSGDSPSKFELSKSGLYPYLKVEDLNSCDKYQISSRQYVDKLKGAVPKGSIIFPKRGAAILNNKIRITTNYVQMDSNMMAITPNEKLLSNEILYYIIVREKLSKIADTSTIPQINNKHILPYKVKIPSSLDESNKIANFLSSVDKKIQQLTEKQSLLQQYKKGIMQKLFSQEIRFKDEQGNDFPYWDLIRLSEILELQDNSIKMDDKMEYELITVRRRNGGVDSRGCFKGKEVLVKNQFKLNSKQFVISKRQIVHGACGLVPEHLEGAIVSNEYNVFEPVESRLDIEYFNIFATTLLMRKAFFINSDGVHIEKLLFKTRSWLKTKILLPNKNEQQKIVSFISVLDKKIELVSQQIKQTKTFKKGLLQQMFV